MARIPSCDQLGSIVAQAGKKIMEYYGVQLERHIKENEGFSTKADIEVEQFLIEQLRQLMPEAKMWAEESGKEAEAEYYWVIDPIDGTTNFSQGVPYFSTSVALVHGAKPILAAVYNPLIDELFCAESGKGATLNGQSIRVSDKRQMCNAVFGVSVAYKITGNHSTETAAWYRIKAFDKQCFSLRIMGSAALDLAQVAAGRLDGVFFERLSWWDIAAGVLLITESGGVVSDFLGKPIDDAFENFVAANQSLHDQMIPLLQG